MQVWEHCPARAERHNTIVIDLGAWVQQVMRWIACRVACCVDEERGQ